MKKFREIEMEGGMDKFMNDFRPIIIVPAAVKDKPHLKFIKEANKLRGWKV
ncbi:MAG: hypothetical protein IT223_07245 [Crocinitomicaceae bacterium]|nr:hypothetical protein [Crocinitomicaceae bacterium]